ncbi:ribosomal protein L21-like protein [Calycina marina]|uniref:Large ribosomal subunit protein bL21m n=1 Tax=Calycina marina TaxID=1763456 RepID=A0A9P8CC93_9HELO|nr:ribosomal protein L21-like protein [Calycina marina]
MLSRTLRKSLLDSRLPQKTLSPTFLLPIRARFFQTTPQHVESPPITTTTSPMNSKSPSTPRTKKSKAETPEIVPIAPPAPPAAPEVSHSIKELLPLLQAQPEHYISAHIHGQPYVVTVGDIVRLPFRMPGVLPGDVLRLDRASSLGSREYTLKGTPYLEDRLFECRARVMSVEAEPLRIKEKKKRRNRRLRTVKSKHKYTVLAIAELKINNLEDIE